MGFNTTRKMKLKPKNWRSTIHRRIAGYFRLFSQILNFSRYMLVSHRNMISLYDMTEHDDDMTKDEDVDSRGKWIQTITFGDVGFIR